MGWLTIPPRQNLNGGATRPIKHEPRQIKRKANTQKTYENKTSSNHVSGGDPKRRPNTNSYNPSQVICLGTSRNLVHRSLRLIAFSSASAVQTLGCQRTMGTPERSDSCASQPAAGQLATAERESNWNGNKPTRTKVDRPIHEYRGRSERGNKWKHY